MTSHLGRNPFQTQKQPEIKTPSKKKKKDSPDPTPAETAGSDSLFVRIPATSFMIALRTTLWVKDKLEGKGLFLKEK
jgi:hypothetical protein